MNQEESLTTKYVQQSRRYRDNALRALAIGDIDKASEFLWGSMAEAMKAVAAAKNIPLRNHRDIWNYAEALAKELGDPSLYDGFRTAHGLHSNFYETHLTAIDVSIDAKKVIETIMKLLTLPILTELEKE